MTVSGVKLEKITRGEYWSEEYRVWIAKEEYLGRLTWRIKAEAWAEWVGDYPTLKAAVGGAAGRGDA